MYKSFNQPYQFTAPQVQPYQYQFYQPQPVMQQPVQPAQNNGLVINAFKIVSEDEAKAYIPEPNTRIMLMDKDQKRFYIKSADSLGIPTLESFEYTKLENLSTDTKTAEFDPKEYVRKGDINDFVNNEKFESSIKALSDQIESLKKNIEGEKNV